MFYALRCVFDINTEKESARHGVAHFEVVIARYEFVNGEGGVATFSGVFTDGGDPDAHNIVVNWGDGTQSSYAAPAGATSFSIDHAYETYSSGAGFSVTATLSDPSSNAASASWHGAQSVSNAPPVMTSVTSDHQTVAVGQNFTVSGTFTDAGLAD